MFPAKSQTTIPMVITTNRYIDPISRLTALAIRSRRPSPEMCGFSARLELRTVHLVHPDLRL